MATQPVADYSEPLCALLGGFLSTDNEVRRQAEDAFGLMGQRDLDGLILSLIKLLRNNCESHVRQQAAVALRTVFRDFVRVSTDDTWHKLRPETKDFLRGQLIESLNCESVKSVRHSVGDVVSNLASRLLINNEWPGLDRQLMALVGSPSSATQAAGLRVLANLIPQLSDWIESNLAGLQHMAFTCSKSPDPDVRYECLSFVAAVVHSEMRKVWKNFQSCIPNFIEGVSSLITAHKEDAATEFLVKLVEIADTMSAFFKPHIGELVSALLAISGNADVDDDPRQMATEVLLCIAEDKPRMCVKLPNFVTEVVRVLLSLMLTIEDDGDWIDQDVDEAVDSTRHYDIGESGLDRFARAIGGESVMGVVFGFVSEYIRRPEWQYKLVGIMAISQTAEYLPEEDVDVHLEEITTMLLAQLKDPHHRVRFAACQAIGQIALDLQPVFQKNYGAQVLPALIESINDPAPRVQSHAAAALINFAEEVEKADLLPYADTLMNLLYERISPQTPRMIREQCVTCIAVVAGVVESDFLKYYPIVIPAAKEILINCTSKEERTIRGKAAECASIIGLSVGPEVFEKDAHEVMRALLQIVSDGVEADDHIKEYFQETFCRICRTLKAGFLPYLPHLVPGILKVLNVKPDIVLAEDADTEDMTLVSIADGQYSGLKTSVVQEMTQALELLSTFVEILGERFGEYLIPAANALLPLLDFRFNDDVKRASLGAMAGVLAATRRLNEGPTGDEAGRAALRQWVTCVLEKVFVDLLPDEDVEFQDIELMVAETGGLAKCLRNAGPDVLTAEQILVICTQVFQLMQNSNQRQAQIALIKEVPEFDDEDIDRIEEEESSEQTLRSTLLEIIAAVMSLHPALFLQNGASLSTSFIGTYLNPSCAADDKALAIYVCDDILEHLKDEGVALWPSFAEKLIMALTDDSPAVRQAAAFGVIQAAKCSKFPTELIQKAATSLVTVLQDPKCRWKTQLSATDNAVAALGALVLHRGADLQPSIQQYLELWIEKLPLRVDDEEGRRVHADLIDLLLKRDPNVLGVNNANMPKLAAVCAAIYRTEFSTAEIDEGIRQFLQKTGFDVIQTIGASFDKKLQKGLERIHRDVVATKA